MKKMIMTVAVLTTMAAGSRADVRWGAFGGRPDIVISNRMFTARSSTFNTASNVNPAVGATYYPSAEAEGSSPYFSAAGSRNLYYGYVMNDDINGDHLWQRNTIVTDNFKSMVVWDWAGDALSWIGIDMCASGSNPVTTVRFIVEIDNNYFISQIVGGASTMWTDVTADAGTLEWYDFQPFINGVATIGDTVLDGFTPAGVTGVGYYFDTTGDISTLTGAKVRSFEAVPEPATALLLVLGGGLTCLFRLKQWL